MESVALRPGSFCRLRNKDEEIAVFCCPSPKSQMVAGKVCERVAGTDMKARVLLPSAASLGRCSGSVWDKSRDRALETFQVVSI